ncbi:hypothetical protein HTV45_03625 [Streptomyces sp. CHD11]|uniref:hypothetical protein n=1 Tax=Streptomyces sp. CHD11 TaxID=2741325 RepID=UPI001BFCCBA2|nr:hypothetical protein [Streptomyces sp. CHD11]MBT3150004.1 hypothetical protein [Streptomyces sp. CHD11]
MELIRRDLLTSSDGSDGPLEGLLAAVQADGQIADALEVLHAALRADGDALGLYGYADAGTGVRSLRPAGISGTSSGSYGGETAYVCPADRCARYWWPDGPASVPHCAISGAALRRERL